ncbi:WD40-repeat-containing domain protein [Mycena floridula]|nr:WD40-repeat-containing domain protein [Mycena floridula]
MASDTSNFLVTEAHLVLDQTRKIKSERIKTLGDPIQLAGKALAISISDGYAWIGENTTVAKKLDLESGKVIQIYKGHNGPVSALAVLHQQKILITGSWDKTIKLWNTRTKELISSTDAHSDFVKSFVVFESLNLLVSGSSDKIVRFWDLSTATEPTPLKSIGSISSHTRPVECLDGRVLSDNTVQLCTADTMGVIRIWTLTRESGDSSRWNSLMKAELNHHRTRINDLRFGNENLWTASSDDTAQILSPPAEAQKPVSLPHPVAVRAILPLTLTDLEEPYLITGAGDVLRVFDVSSLEEPTLIREIDGHWHDITDLGLWARKSVGEDGTTRVEPWILSVGLDGTIRRWKLSGMLFRTLQKMANILQPAPLEVEKPAPVPDAQSLFEISEEEERELAELLDSD